MKQEIFLSDFIKSEEYCIIEIGEDLEGDSIKKLSKDSEEYILQNLKSDLVKYLETSKDLLDYLELLQRKQNSNKKLKRFSNII